MTQRLTRRGLGQRLAAPLRQASQAALPSPASSSGSAIPLEYHVLSRATFGRNDQSLAEIQARGIDDWLDWQLDHLNIDDSALESGLDTLAPPQLQAGADIRLLARAIFSRRQLAWRMTHFLNNHFSTWVQATQGISESKEDEAFHKDCFGSFATVLEISATSPTMIDYLDSVNNIAASPNENYARELMELHTMGVGTGYTESDVAEAARIFTGWSRRNFRPGGPGTPVLNSHFFFRPFFHDTGAKSISLGWSTPGISGRRGYLEGIEFLQFLALHPATASRFVGKLCQYFVADQPPAALEARVLQVFTSTGGDLKQTVRAIFRDPLFGDAALMREKVLDGFEFMAALTRRLEITGPRLRTLYNEVTALGGRPHQNPVPTGYPEVAAPWQGAGNILPRWRTAEDLVQGNLNQVNVPWATLIPNPVPTTPKQWVDHFATKLLDGDLPRSSSQSLTSFFAGRLATLPPGAGVNQFIPHLRDLVSIMLRLPESNLS